MNNTVISGEYNTATVFTDNIEQSAVDQIKTMLNYKHFKDLSIKIMPDCLTDNTEVLTLNGFKLIKDLNKETDMIANYDNLTGKVFFSKPLGIIKRPLREDEKVYSFSSKRMGFEFMVTENHRMLTRDGNVVLAKDISNTTTLSNYVFSGKMLKDNLTTNNYSDLDIQLICWVVGDGSISSNLNSKGKRAIAETAASKPLLPDFVPARSIAC